eukprot:scaffold1316_cov130-Isochrysis_galbana.AAC.9
MTGGRGARITDFSRCGQRERGNARSASLALVSWGLRFCIACRGTPLRATVRAPAQQREAVRPRRLDGGGPRPLPPGLVPSPGHPRRNTACVWQIRIGWRKP